MFKFIFVNMLNVNMLNVALTSRISEIFYSVLVSMSPPPISLNIPTLYRNNGREEAAEDQVWCGKEVEQGGADVPEGSGRWGAKGSADER